MLIDTHAHLDSIDYDEDLDDIIAKLLEHEVELVINPSSDIKSLERVKEIVNKYSNIYGAMGIHPHDAKDIDDNIIDKIIKYSKDEKIVAIGEIGLDYYYEHSSREVQKEKFREQIRIAKELKLPIIVHERDAAKDTLDIITSEKDNNLIGVLHCYSGNIEIAREYIDMGFYISFAGPVTFKNAVKPKNTAKEVPLNRLLIETDSPYLTPTPYRGKRNEPSYVRYVAENIAKLKEIEYEEVVKNTSINAKKLFEIK